MKYWQLGMVLFSAFLSGCGSYTQTHESYAPKPKYNKTEPSAQSDYFIQCSLEPTLVSSKKLFIWPKSDLYGSPFIFKFSAVINHKPCSSLLIHSFTLSDEKSTFFEFDPENPVSTKNAEEIAGGFITYYSTNLCDQLAFEENKILFLRLDWEIPDVAERQIYEAEFFGIKDSFSYPIRYKGIL